MLGVQKAAYSLAAATLYTSLQINHTFMGAEYTDLDKMQNLKVTESCNIEIY